MIIMIMIILIDVVASITITIMIMIMNIIIIIISSSSTKGVPRKGVWTSVNVRVWTCKELKAEHDQTSCYSRPPFLGTP